MIKNTFCTILAFVTFIALAPVQAYASTGQDTTHANGHADQDAKQDQSGAGHDTSNDISYAVTNQHANCNSMESCSAASWFYDGQQGQMITAQ